MVAWAVLVSLARALLFALRLEALVPHALVFANPVLLQESTTRACDAYAWSRSISKHEPRPIHDRNQNRKHTPHSGSATTPNDAAAQAAAAAGGAAAAGAAGGAAAAS